MFNFIRENIEFAQEQAKQRISLVLKNRGYQLTTDLHHSTGIETQLYQWTNSETKHCIQLIWDGKEDWFDLGEFQFSDNLNYLNASQILLLPIKRTKLFNRKQYILKRVDQLIEALKK